MESTTALSGKKDPATEGMAVAGVESCNGVAAYAEREVRAEWGRDKGARRGGDKGCWREGIRARGGEGDKGCWREE
jgi:hypothetical protein